MSATPIKIVIADDHPVFRDGFRFMLHKLKNENIILEGEAGNGKELLSLVEEVKPDLVITDILMPEMDGVEATKHITANFPDTSVIAISMCAEEAMVVEMFEAGAKGYLLKNASRDEIYQSINVVSQRGLYFSNSTSRSLMSAILTGNLHPFKKGKTANFTSQEIKIMRLICQQKCTKEMAAAMDLSARTVEDYRYKLQEKTGARCAVGIALYAIKHELVKWEEL